MTTCPNCGADLKAARKLVATSAKELVESLRLDADLIAWCRKNAPGVDADAEMEAFKDRMRMTKYRTNAGPVADAHAAFRYHMRNAVKFSKVQQNKSKPPQQIRLAPYKTE